MTRELTALVASKRDDIAGSVIRSNPMIEIAKFDKSFIESHGRQHRCRKLACTGDVAERDG